MRLIAWNANYNNRRHPFRDTVEILEPLCADILVLSEVAPPVDGDPRRVQRVGGVTPGLVVVARGGWELQALPENNQAPSLAGAFRVRGAADFFLVAAWPIQNKGGPSYHKTLMAILDCFGETLKSGHAILAGDLNSSSRVSSQKTTHPKFVEAAKVLGLASAYHEQSGEGHGVETVATYPGRGGFHIDYCFVPQALAATANVSVLGAGDWPTRSDHFPVVVDIPDRAFTQPSPGRARSG